MTTLSSYACFFPTQTIFIDDDQDFLDSLILNLPEKGNFYKFFSNPEVALQFIRNQANNFSWINEYINNPDIEEPEHNFIEVNVSGLHKQHFNRSRFPIISNVIIDFNMPQINGLDLCKALEDLSISKTLLTGAADEKLAVQAFNNKLINYFIPKQSSSIYKDLADSINQGHSLYFNNISQIIWSSISKDCYLQKSVDFSNFFSKLIEINDIVEYYLLESTGNYLLINSVNLPNILYISSEKQLDSLYELLSEDDIIPASSLEDIRTHKIMVCYSEILGSKYPTNWVSTLRPANTIMIDGINYYYHYEKNANIILTK